eukprot:TRINITY_DN116656_c0_g1_i1.p1 TRINITY_DN116656_c0_g1~~TRINITY_DN116656_c0_g1_i1.p1  ORF type:complete len:205 (-),score=78.16 TRINITY_DN116656_c0_g1_i1:44-658(-)
MAPKKKGGGYSSTKPPVAPKKESKTDEQGSDASESEEDSEEDSESDSGTDGEAQQQEIPKFKTKAELRAWEEEIAKKAMDDTKTIKRLEEVRARREKLRLEKEAAEKQSADEEARRKAEAEAAEEVRQKALQERPELELPGPKDVKTACMKLQECASEEFLKKHGLKGATGNKLAKIKHADFKKIFEDFQDNAELAQLHKYKGT